MKITGFCSYKKVSLSFQFICDEKMTNKDKKNENTCLEFKDIKTLNQEKIDYVFQNQRI